MSHCSDMGGSTVFSGCPAYGLSYLDEHHPRCQWMVRCRLWMGMALIFWLLSSVHRCPEDAKQGTAHQRDRDTSPAEVGVQEQPLRHCPLGFPRSRNDE